MCLGFKGNKGLGVERFRVCVSDGRLGRCFEVMERRLCASSELTIVLATVHFPVDSGIGELVAISCVVLGTSKSVEMESTAVIRPIVGQGRC
jgi:hypothetical protein